jgi:serine/threonine-protein kinase
MDDGQERSGARASSGNPPAKPSAETPPASQPAKPAGIISETDIVPRPSVISRAELVGSTIDGRYIVEALIGEGGMGLVYRCRHRALGKLVAVKVLHRELAHDRDLTDRFVLEAKAASAVGSAHIADTLDFGELRDGSTYLAMEYLEGHTLSEVLEAEGHLLPPRAAHIGRQIAKGLGAAHIRGIIHRDLKPDNVFLVDRDGDPDFVKILDFGIAKVASAQNQLTRVGAVFGTPQYMSPEQASAASVDHRSDIYALGVILYEMATGKVPFDGDAPLSVMSQHVNDEPIPPSARPDSQRLPAMLEAIIMRCLAKHPADRFATMSELADALRRLSDPTATPLEAPVVLTRRKADSGGAPSVRATVSSVPPTFTPAARRRWPLLAAIVGLSAAGAVIFGLQSRQPAPSATAAVPAPAAPPPTSAQAQAPLPAPAPQPPAEPAPSASPAVRQVALVLSPVDAVVYRGNRRLGPMPVSINVPDGERIKLLVMRDGFWARKITVDGLKSRVVVRLVAIPGVKPLVPVPDGGKLEPDTETQEPVASAAAQPATGAPAAGKDQTPPADDSEAE